MSDVDSVSDLTDIDRTVGLLGGATVLHRRIATAVDTHDLLETGLPGRALDHLVGHVSLLKQAKSLERALGISGRTYYRRKKAHDIRPLSREQSGRIWKFAEILGRASTLMGSQDAAEHWLESPAIGLDQRRPIDLLSTPAGTELVEDYLTRIEYGVYA